MPPRRWATNLDMYRKVPTDLLEGTKRGSILSSLAVLVIVMLFVLETSSFLSSRIVTDLALDGNTDKRIRLNFNITMMDLRCEFAVIDVVSVLGENQNVTAHVTKWTVDAEGVRQRFGGRNKQQDDLIELRDEGVTDSLEDLHEDGEDAISLDKTTLQFARNENEYLFVDFYASWCSHCKDLAPTWETLAEVMTAVADERLKENEPRYWHEDYSEEEYEKALLLERPVFVGKVDCVMHKEMCTEQAIRAYPTLRLFVDGKFKEDYRGHRTVLEMTSYLKKVEEDHKGDVPEDERTMDEVHKAALEHMDKSDEEIDWEEKMKLQKNRKHHVAQWRDEDHPGCQLYGYLMLDRVPGNFHIQARSAHHDLAPHMTNVSHVVHHLSVGEPAITRNIDQAATNALPSGVRDKLSPMDGNVYVSQELHEAYHHYLKIVSTNLDDLKIGWRGKKMFRAYQMLQSSQLSYYRSDIVPEAKFMYDLSPISVSYRSTSQHWYDYLTSLMAIIGGTFTVVGMMEGSIRAVSARKKHM